MKLVELTSIVLAVNAAIDSHPTVVPIQDARDHIERGDVLDWLSASFDADVSFVSSRPKSVEEYSRRLRDLLGAYEGGERRKWGIENNGLNLILAWTNELIQQRDWTE